MANVLPETADDIPSFLKEYGLEIFTACLLGYTAYRVWKWPRNLPPGPRNWPIQRAIRNPEAMHEDLMQLGDKYGDVFSFYIGNQ